MPNYNRSDFIQEMLPHSKIILIQAYPLAIFYFNYYSSPKFSPFHLFFLESGIRRFLIGR